MSSEVTTRPATTKAVALNMKQPDALLNTAANLAKFIKDNKLSSTIQGKEYVQVEGWQFAGTRLGIVPKMGPVVDLSIEGEIRFRATVSLYDLHNKIEIGGGVAECSNKEKTKRFYESYAICSMAQTRAVGKAYRNVLAWLIKAAGFEATPWEEMTDVVDAGTGAEVVQEPRPMKAVPAEPVASAPALEAPAPSATADQSSAPVDRATEAQLQQLVQLIASPELDVEERDMLLSMPVDLRPAAWVEKTLKALPSVVAERKDAKTALAAAQKQLRTTAARFQKDMADATYQAIILRASAITAKPAELRAESRALLAQFQPVTA